MIDLGTVNLGVLGGHGAGSGRNTITAPRRSSRPGAQLHRSPLGIHEAAALDRESRRLEVSPAELRTTTSQSDLSSKLAPFEAEEVFAETLEVVG